jgi:hypothetical protein
MTPASPTGWVTPLGSVSGGQRVAQLPVQTDRPEWASGTKTYSVRPVPFTSTDPTDGTDATAIAYEGGGPAVNELKEVLAHPAMAAPATSRSAARRPR